MQAEDQEKRAASQSSQREARFHAGARSVYLELAQMFDADEIKIEGAKP